jgi:hypothetical protein
MRAPLPFAIALGLAATFAGGAAVAAEPAVVAEPTVATTPAAKPAPAPRPTAPIAGSPTGPAAPAAARPTVAAATGAAPARTTPAPAPTPAGTRTVAAAPAPAGALHEPAPRPMTDVRVQSRFAVKAKTTQLFGAAEYLSRGDYYNSPGVRVGATYYPLEALGVELHVSHYWSSLNETAERVKRELGALPDSHAPAWLILAGGRYSIGYGKLMIGGLGGAIHFEPQAFLHVGVHAHDGDTGPSGDGGLGLLVFLTPKMFARIDAAIVYEREDRSGTTVSVWGTLPSLAVGGTL